MPNDADICGAAPASGSFDPDLFEWDAWRPEEAQHLLAGVEAPWCVAAGWAIDLYLGEQRREHEDLEIAVPSDRFGEITEALAEFELFVVGDHFATPLAQAGGLLDTYHQTWVQDQARPPVKRPGRPRGRSPAARAGAAALADRDAGGRPPRPSVARRARRTRVKWAR